MGAPMNSEDLLQAQRRLRGQLLERRDAAVPGALDLAAHLLVYLDDEARCWQLTLDWVRTTLDADRASGCFAGPAQAVRVAQAESLRPGLGLASALGTIHEAGEAWLHDVWSGAQPDMSDDVSRDPRFTPSRRRQLKALGTGAQLALALRDGGAPVGLILCGWNTARPGWTPALLREVDIVAREMLGPILRVAGAVAGRCGAPAAVGGMPAPSRAAVSLTPGELAVARLVVTGMSYKEIAHRLNRSFSTVDHRLRAIREKLGARSTARMVAVLTELLDAPALALAERSAVVLPGGAVAAGRMAHEARYAELVN